MSYVLVPVSKAKSSLEARRYAFEILSDDPTFVGEEGRFATPVCDWFVIGGRWSGRLHPKKLRKNFYNQVRRLLDIVSPYMPDSSFVEEHYEELDTIWGQLGGINSSLLTRDRTHILGQEDDACMIDNRLAEKLNFFLHENDEYGIDGCYLTERVWWRPIKVISLDENLDMLPELENFHALIGKYWVVVIDYHF